MRVKPRDRLTTYLNTRFDGDMMSYIAICTDDARQEIQDLLNSRKYHIGPDGHFSFSASTDIINYVLANITG